MPAAIRIDVKLVSITASDDRPAAVRARVKDLADTLAERVRAKRPDLKVLFTSGYNEEISAADFEGKTTTRFLPKPWDIETMLKEVAEILSAPVTQA